jgi:tetratricopeptide (TPR) repeat protein
MCGLLFAAILPISSPQAAPVPTFSRDIAPIVFNNCVTCHQPGHNSPFSLQTYDDVRSRADEIAAATRSHYMPPWKPETGYGGPFQGARGLSEKQIETIGRWVAAGTLEGDPNDLPQAPRVTGDWRLGTPDVVIRMPEPFELAASGPDVFRNFVLPIPSTGPRYVQAVEFVAGSHAVHHANLRIDETEASRQRDAEDPLPGYDGLMAPSARYPEGYFLGWTPGQLPPMSPELAWRLNPGSDVVVQLHLRPTGHMERVQVAIGLYFASAPPRLLPTMLRLGKQYMNIPPGKKDYVVTDSYTLPVDVDVHAVQPHAHYRARQIEGFAKLPDGKTKWLIRIPDWDFDWQDTYRYVEPLSLPKGTTLTMRYTYDNSTANPRNPQLPPQRVRWGQNSTDEMGDLWIQVVAHSAADLDVLMREFRQKVFREDILGYESVLDVTPDDVSLHDDVALLYMAVGRINDAIAHFSRSVRLAPNMAATHFNLGTALTAAGRVDEAIAEYRRALEMKPDYAVAHNNLGSVLLARGNIKDAALHLSRAIEIDPGRADARNNLAKLLAFEGRTGEALEHLRRALELQPDYPDAHYNLAKILLATNRASEAAEHYRAALALRPDWAPVLKEAAWLLATHPSQTVTDPVQAVLFAERAVAVTGRRNADALDTLAAAYAASGDFDKAISTARMAIDLIEDQSSSATSAMRSRLNLYRQRRPFVDTP